MVAAGEAGDVTATGITQAVAAVHADIVAGGDAAVALSDDEHRLARDLEQVSAKLSDAKLQATERSFLQDQLGVLAARCQWVQNDQQRTFLEEKVDSLLEQLPLVSRTGAECCR